MNETHKQKYIIIRDKSIQIQIIPFEKGEKVKNLMTPTLMKF